MDKFTLYDDSKYVNHATNECRNFGECYELGKKDMKEQMINKACEWLSNLPLEDMTYKYNDFDSSEGWYKFIEDFRKAMEKEK